MTKMLSANQIWVLFNCHYLLNGLTSEFDFLHVDRHEWKEQGLLIWRKHALRMPKILPTNQI